MIWKCWQFKLIYSPWPASEYSILFLNNFPISYHLSYTYCLEETDPCYFDHTDGWFNCSTLRIKYLSSSSHSCWISNEERTIIIWQSNKCHSHLVGGTLVSSSSSVSLGMVMMLTAGLGVSEMIIGWEGSPLVCNAEDMGLRTTNKSTHSAVHASILMSKHYH